MQIGTFRKNVMKTVSTKPAKAGLKQVARNTQRTNIAHATVALKRDVGHVLQALSQYVLGVPLSQEMKIHAANVLGDVGYDLTILCRSLKVKMPAATKKSKLVGTNTAALLHLDSLTTDMLNIVSGGLFQGPQVIMVKKTVVLPNKGGIKEERDVPVVDKVAEAEEETKRQETLKVLLSGVVDVFWRLCFSLYHDSPSGILQSKFVRMQSEFPGVEFDTEEKKPAVKKAVKTEDAKPVMAAATK